MIAWLLGVSVVLVQEASRRELPPQPSLEAALDRLALAQEPLIGVGQDPERMEEWLGALSDRFQEREPLEQLFQGGPSLEDLVDVWMGMAGAAEADRLDHPIGPELQERLLELLRHDVLRGAFDPADFPGSARWLARVRKVAGDPGLSGWTGPANVGYLLYGLLSRRAGWPDSADADRSAFVLRMLRAARSADDEAVTRVVLHALRPSLAAPLALAEGTRTIAMRAPAPDGYPGRRDDFGFTREQCAFVEEWLQAAVEGWLQEPGVPLSPEELGPGVRCAMTLHRRMRAEGRPGGPDLADLERDLAGPYPVALEAWARLLELVGPRPFRQRAWPAVRAMLAGTWPVPGLEGPRTEQQPLRTRRRQVQEQMALELARLYCRSTAGAAEGWEGMLELVDGGSGHEGIAEHPAFLPSWLTLANRDPTLAADLLRHQAEGGGPLPARATEAILARIAAHGRPSSAEQQVVERLAQDGRPRERAAALSAARVLGTTTTSALFSRALEDLPQIRDPQAARLLFQGACELLAGARPWTDRRRALRALARATSHLEDLSVIHDPRLRQELAPLLDEEQRKAFLQDGRLPSSGSDETPRR